MPGTCLNDVIEIHFQVFLYLYFNLLVKSICICIFKLLKAFVFVSKKYF